MKVFILCFLILFGRYANAEDDAFQKLIIEKIECVGNEKTSCEIIKNEFYQDVGDVVSPEKIQDGKLRLGVRGLFKAVDIRLKKGSKKDYVVIEIAVEEESSIQGQISTSKSFYKSKHFSSRSSLFSGQLSDYNFLGTGKTLIGSVDYLTSGIGNSKFLTGGLTYIDPHVFGSRNYFFNYNLSVDRAYYEEDWKQESYEQTLSLGRRFGNFHSISLSGTIEDLYNIIGSDKSLYRVQLKYGYNSLNDLFFPTNGTRIKVAPYYYWPDDYIIKSNRYGHRLFYQKFFSKNDRNVFELGLSNSFESGAGSKWVTYGVNGFYHRDFKKDQYDHFLVNTRMKIGPKLLLSKGSSEIEWVSTGVELGLALELSQVLVDFNLSYQHDFVR